MNGIIDIFDICIFFLATQALGNVGQLQPGSLLIHHNRLCHEILISKLFVFHC